MNADLLDNIVPNPESQTTGSISFFIQEMCFSPIPCNSHYYIFDPHNRDNLGQSNENGYSITMKHILNFITTKNLINNQLQHVYGNKLIFFPEVERSTKRSAIRKLRCS